MTRIRADFCLLLVAAIWGMAFVAQKSAMDHLGPFGFTGVRFLLSLLVVAPFTLREWRRSTLHAPSHIMMRALPVCAVFAGGVFLQQVGVMETSVTNAGFLTGLYVLFTPFIAWLLFRHRPNPLIWPACAASLAGVWFLSGGTLSSLAQGDVMILFCAVFFAAHVALTGWFLSFVTMPFTLVLIQYLVCVIVGFTGAFLMEDLSWQAIAQAGIPLLYGGLVSGGVAYTLQAVAQQYTPPSDAAIILSSESLFAALGGVLLLSEVFTGQKLIGCSLILLGILCVEVKSYLARA